MPGRTLGGRQAVATGCPATGNVGNRQPRQSGTPGNRRVLCLRDAGNNRAVSTATASSSLNCPGVRGGTGLVVSVAGTGYRRLQPAGCSHRAGTVRLGRRPRPAPAAGSMRRAIPCGSRRPGTPGPARPAVAGVPPGRTAGPRCHWRREHSSCHRRRIRSRQARDLARRRASGTDGLSRLRGNARAMSTAMGDNQAGGHALLR